MKSRIPSALAVALLGLVAVGPKTAAALDTTIRNAGYTFANGTAPAPATSLNLPMQIPNSVKLPVHVTGSLPATTVGFHHRHAYYGPSYAYGAYYSPYVAFRPYYYPRPYVYTGFYPPYSFYGAPGAYLGPSFYETPAAYGRGYWGAYPGCYHW